MSFKYLYSKDYFWDYTNNLKRNQMYLQEIERINRITRLKKGKILDIGCGLGDLLSLFSNNWEKFGTEISDYARKKASQKKIKFKIPITKNFFDMIIFRGTIQHLDTPLSELKKRIGQLKKGGWIVFLATPNAGSIYYRIWQDLPMLDKKRNFIVFSDKQLINILENFGLKVKKIYYPYINTPYANSFFDHLNFVLKIIGLDKHFPFWRNLMEIYAQKK